MKNKKLKSSKVLLFFAGISTTLTCSSAALATVNSNTLRENKLNLKANVFKYINFKAGSTSATLTGKTTVPVKPGKIFHTVKERPIATLSGYNFVCWSATEFTPGTGSISDAFPETTAITQNKDLYPIFTPIGVEGVQVLGTTALRQAETAYYKAIVTPSYAKTTDVTWKVFDEDPSTTEPQTQSAKATITRVTTGEHTGEGLLTPIASAATGNVWVQATSALDTSKRHSIKVEIINAAPTKVTIQMHSSSPSTIKVGEETIIDATVEPAGAAQKVNWAIESSSGSTGCAEIVTAGDTQLTVKGVTPGEVTIKARANGTTVTSNAVKLTINKAEATGITISGPTRMDVKDKSKYNATVTPAGTTATITWHAFEHAETTDPTVSTIASIDQTGTLTVLPSASLEDGGKYVYVAASTVTQSGTIWSDRLPVRVFDILSFLYTYVDNEGDRWIYDYRTLETNDSSVQITRTCYDNPSKTYTPVARSSFNEPVVIGRWVTSIGDNFLANCTNFNSYIYFDSPIADISSLESIGDGFLFGCTKFNQQFNIPGTVTYIGADFMEGCIAYAQKITISNSVRHVGDYFMHNCQNFKDLQVDTITDFDQVWQDSVDVVSVRDGQAAAYEQGVNVSGSGSAAFVAKYPHLEGEQQTGYQVWRNLIQGAVPVTVDGIKYTLSEGEPYTAYVYGLDPEFQGNDLVIPQTITYNEVTYTVIGISNNAFRDNELLQTASIPTTVTSIGEYAFYDCPYLATVTFANESTLDSIGYAAFARCPILATCTLPATVRTIDDGAFFYCPLLTTVGISNLTSLEYIGIAAFAACLTYNEQISLPASLTTIGEDAFYDCFALPSVTLNKFTNLCTIGSDIFTGCSSLANITLVGWTEASAAGWNASVDSGVSLFDSISRTGTLTYPTTLSESEEALKTLFAGWSGGSIVFAEGYWTAVAE